MGRSLKEIIDSYDEDFLEYRIDKLKKSYEEFYEGVKGDDNLLVVLRAHHYIEHELSILLSKYLINISKLNMSYFKQKLDLANSLGLLDKNLYENLNHINKVRNKFAHEINFDIGEDDLKYFYARLYEVTKESLLSEGSSDIKDILSGVWAELAVLSDDLTLRLEFILNMDKSLREDIKRILQEVEEKKQTDSN